MLATGGGEKAGQVSESLEVTQVRGAAVKHHRPGVTLAPEDMIVHAATRSGEASDLTFTVPRASLAQAMAVIEQRKDSIGYAELIDDDSVAKVSIVGVGIRSNPGLAAKMFETLAERQINLLAVSSSEIKVSALIAEAELDLAVRVLHSAFGLDSE